MNKQGGYCFLFQIDYNVNVWIQSKYQELTVTFSIETMRTDVMFLHQGWREDPTHPPSLPLCYLTCQREAHCWPTGLTVLLHHFH